MDYWLARTEMVWWKNVAFAVILLMRGEEDDDNDGDGGIDYDSDDGDDGDEDKSTM